MSRHNPLKILVSHLCPPPFPGGVAPRFGSEKVSRYTGVSQVQMRVSRYTVQLSLHPCIRTAVALIIRGQKHRSPEKQFHNPFPSTGADARSLPKDEEKIGL